MVCREDTIGGPYHAQYDFRHSRSVGSRDKANQKWENPIGRLDPTYQSVKAYFPEANIICYSDDESIGDGYDVEVRHIDSESTPFDKDYREGSGKLKWGYHCCDD